MEELFIIGGLVVFVLLLAADVMVGLRNKRVLTRVQRVFVPFDTHGAIVGKPTRAQWRLRRRALQEAAAICDDGAGETARALAERIRARIKSYDEQSPEFSGFCPLPVPDTRPLPRSA